MRALERGAFFRSHVPLIRRPPLCSDLDGRRVALWNHNEPSPDFGNVLQQLHHHAHCCTSSVLRTRPAPSLWILRSTASLSSTTRALPASTAASSSTGLQGNPSPIFHARGASAEGFQMPPMTGPPSGEWKRRKVDG